MFQYNFLLQCLTFMNIGIGFQVNHLTENCNVFDSGSTIVFCNRVRHNEIPKNDEIEAIKEYFGDRQFSWIVDSDDMVTQNVLEENGINQFTLFPAMVKDLDTVMPYNFSDDIKVNVINIETNDFKEWLMIISKCFGMPQTQVLKFVRTIQEQLKFGAYRFYIGYYKGEPTSAGYILEHEKIVSLHLIGTLPEFRKKGLGYAITHEMLMNAKQRGCNQAILLSSYLGRSVYERLGFTQYFLYRIYNYSKSKALSKVPGILDAYFLS